MAYLFYTRKTNLVGAIAVYLALAGEFISKKCVRIFAYNIAYL